MLARAHAALEPGGQIVLEPQTYEHVHGGGESTCSWYTAPRGLFSDRPHLVLQEGSWDEVAQTRTERFFVIDAETGAVTRHALSNEAYTEAQLTEMLEAAGFSEVTHFASLIGEKDAECPYNGVVVGGR